MGGSSFMRATLLTALMTLSSLLPPSVFAQVAESSADRLRLGMTDARLIVEGMRVEASTDLRVLGAPRAETTEVTCTRDRSLGALYGAGIGIVVGAIVMLVAGGSNDEEDILLLAGGLAGGTGGASAGLLLGAGRCTSDDTS